MTSIAVDISADTAHFRTLPKSLTTDEQLLMIGPDAISTTSTDWHQIQVQRIKHASHCGPVKLGWQILVRMVSADDLPLPPQFLNPSCRDDTHTRKDNNCRHCDCPDCHNVMESFLSKAGLPND